MPRFRKKPVVIEAVIYEPGLEDGFIVGGRYYDKLGDVPRAMGRKPAIKTLEGHHEISPGDWIITGIKGERYPCKPDIFEATYEQVE
ncbi:MAG: PGDYG domain-containing protein [Opitutales bacterium]|nr:PGDYG domain-containing protein [Opitutales bacterium]